MGLGKLLIADAVLPTVMVAGNSISMTIDDAKKLLRKAELRCTAARIAVVQTLGDAELPLSPSDVADQLAEYGFDKSTIYRSLSELHQAAVVLRLDLGDATRRFELADWDENGQAGHPHFMCVDCGKVQCLSGYRIDIRPEDPDANESLGEISQILVKGHCPACL